MMISSTLSNIIRSWITLPSQTHLPTAFFSTTFLFAILKRRNTFRILLAGSPLLRTLFLDALLWVGQNKSSWRFFFYLSKAIVGGSTLGNIVCSWITLSSQTHFPASFLCTTFLFAILKSGYTFRILLAGSPLIRTVLFNAFLRVDQNQSSWRFFN